MFQKLGCAYYFGAEFPEVLKWHDQLFIPNENIKQPNLYSPSQCAGVRINEINYFIFAFGITLYPEQVPEYLYLYSQALKSDGNYIKANQVLGLFNAKRDNDKRGALFVDAK